MSVNPRTFLRLSLAAVLLAVVSHTRADPDLWGHVRFGADMLSSHGIPTMDVYSFMSDRMWINHEWLAECAMAVAYLAGGGPGLAALKFLVVLATLVMIWIELGRQQVEPGLRDVLLALAIVGIFPQANHVRPQVFSLVSFAALLVCLLHSDRSRRWLLAVPPIFALWVNLHGGWIVGGGVLALWTALTVVGSAPGSRKVLLLVTGVLSLVATLANPYGWRMWEFLASTVGFGRVEITDWQPIYRLGTGYLLLWIALAIAAGTAGARLVRRAAWDARHLAVVGLLGVASFRVSRLLAFFAIATVLLVGRGLSRALADRRPEATPAVSPRGQVSALHVIVPMAIALALLAGGALMTVRNLGCVRVAVAEQAEPDVVGLVKEARLRGRLVVWFDWGEYAIWHFAPELQVSIDGRRETVYTDAVMQRHLQFYYSPGSRTGFLQEAKADHVWLPANLPVVSGLLADGWEPVYRGPRSVWMSRDPAVTTRVNQGAAGEIPNEFWSTARCFPGP